jgi:hypothetical protein
VLTSMVPPKIVTLAIRVTRGDEVSFRAQRGCR